VVYRFSYALILAEAVTLNNRIEPLKPLFVEGLIRSENQGIYRTLRNKVNVPIAVESSLGTDGISMN